MSPLRGEEFTGRSVEEAIERGLRSLGKKRTDVEYEVLEKGKPANVLGIGGGGGDLVARQQITAAITSRRVGRTVHVPLDIEGYRRRREEQLREIARRVAARVRTSGQAVTLEPMLAYERRIVHLAVQDTPGVKTESVGIDPNRRVVISSTAPGARGPAPFRPRAGGYRGGPPGRYGPRRGFGPRPGGYQPRSTNGPRDRP